MWRFAGLRLITQRERDSKYCFERMWHTSATKSLPTPSGVSLGSEYSIGAYGQSEDDRLSYILKDCMKIW